MRDQNVSSDVRAMARSSGLLALHGQFDRRLISLTARVSKICATIADQGGRLESMLSAVAGALSGSSQQERDFATLLAFRCSTIAIEHDPFDDDTAGERIQRLFAKVRADDVVEQVANSASKTVRVNN